MGKWADFGISEVRYSDEGDHITKVKVHEDKGEKLGFSEEWTRSQVVSAINSGEEFITVVKNSENKWIKGEKVHIIKIDGSKYLRTDRNNRSSDNLGDLPEF